MAIVLKNSFTTNLQSIKKKNQTKHDKQYNTFSFNKPQQKLKAKPKT